MTEDMSEDMETASEFWPFSLNGFPSDHAEDYRREPALRVGALSLSGGHAVPSNTYQFGHVGIGSERKDFPRALVLRSNNVPAAPGHMAPWRTETPPPPSVHGHPRPPPYAVKYDVGLRCLAVPAEGDDEHVDQQSHCGSETAESTSNSLSSASVKEEPDSDSPAIEFTDFDPLTIGLGAINDAREPPQLPSQTLGSILAPDTAASGRFVAARSNHQNILDGKTTPLYPLQVTEHPSSRQMRHRIGEKNRRDRLTAAIHELGRLLPMRDGRKLKIRSRKARPSGGRKNRSGDCSSKLEVVELAIEYIRELKQDRWEGRDQEQEQEQE